MSSVLLGIALLSVLLLLPVLLLLLILLLLHLLGRLFPLVLLYDSHLSGTFALLGHSRGTRLSQAAGKLICLGSL